MQIIQLWNHGNMEIIQLCNHQIMQMIPLYNYGNNGYIALLTFPEAHVVLSYLALVLLIPQQYSITV